MVKAMSVKYIFNQRVEHKPFYKPYKGAKAIIIFIHGILESPNQFKSLADYAYQRGFSVAALLLPGHGGSGSDFANTNLLEWRLYVEHYILGMKKRYKTIILVGHSMGALLSLDSYFKIRRSIKGIILIGMPLYVRFNIRGLIGGLKVGFGVLRTRDCYTLAAFKASSIQKTSFWKHIYWIPRYLDLFILIKVVRKQLDNIYIPTLIIQSAKDEFVSIRSIKCFEDKMKQSDKGILILKESAHFYYSPEDTKHLRMAFKQFIEQYNPSK